MTEFSKILVDDYNHQDRVVDPSRFKTRQKELENRQEEQISCK